MKIQGFDYTVDTSRLVREIGSLGDCDWDRLILRVAKDLPRQQQEATILHEILEAINRHFELGLTHPQLASLEIATHQVFDANGVNLSPLLKGLDE